MHGMQRIYVRSLGITIRPELKGNHFDNSNEHKQAPQQYMLTLLEWNDINRISVAIVKSLVFSGVQ